MKAKKLIEVALPIKEISAESLRDKSIRSGHISTLHLWWARRPLPACRAAVFASLIPDPIDPNCTQAFKDAVDFLLAPKDDSFTEMEYAPYKDIPYTAIFDPMEDNLRNRLMMYIGKFSGLCQENMKNGKTTPAKDQLSNGSLIKWENRNNTKVINIARELIWVAYNSEKDSALGFESLHNSFNNAIDSISKAEERLISLVDRQEYCAEVSDLESSLSNAIEYFQSQMPSVFDPFSGGGAIPLEAARLGCRSYGNDINPVAHLIERCSAEFPQKFGKPIVYSNGAFKSIYGEEGMAMAMENGQNIIHSSVGYYIPNRLSFDVEYYARKLFKNVEHFGNELYPKIDNTKPLVFYWAKVAKCTNPSCNAEVPLLGQFYISKRRGTPKKQWSYLSPIINGNKISFEIAKGECKENAWISRANMTCPCCGSVTEAKELKKQFKSHNDNRRLLYIVSESNGVRKYTVPTEEYLNSLPHVCKTFSPIEPMPIEYTQALPSCTWGIEKWGQLFSDRQLSVINANIEGIENIKKQINDNTEYSKAVITYLTFLLDRIIVRYTEFGVWHVLQETVEHPFGRQAIPMKFSYPEMNPFSELSGAFFGQLSAITSYIKEENSFPAIFKNSSSGEKEQFNPKSLSCVVTDPPYYDAIAYADLSDFFMYGKSKFCLISIQMYLLHL